MIVNRLGGNRNISQIEITRLSRASWFKIETNNKIVYFDPGYAGYFKNQRIPLRKLEESRFNYLALIISMNPGSLAATF